MSYRQLGEATNYDYTYLIRVASGQRMPTWEVTEAFLAACDVGPVELDYWHRFWKATKEADRSWKAIERGTGDQAQASAAAIIRHADGTEEPFLGTAMVRREVQGRLIETEMLTGLLRESFTSDQLGQALTRLGHRTGLVSLRQMAEATHVPRSTLHGWRTGERLPDSAKLDALVVRLGASLAEQHEFAQCLERISADRQARLHQRNGPILEFRIGADLGGHGYELLLTTDQPVDSVTVEWAGGVPGEWPVGVTDRPAAGPLGTFRAPATVHNLVAGEVRVLGIWLGLWLADNQPLDLPLFLRCEARVGNKSWNLNAEVDLKDIAGIHAAGR